MKNKIKKIITAAIVLITLLVFGGQIALSAAVLLSILLLEMDNKKIAWLGLSVAALLPFLTIIGLKTLAASLAPWLFFLLAGVFAAHLVEYVKSCFIVETVTQESEILSLPKPIAVVALPIMENAQEQKPTAAAPVLIAENKIAEEIPVIPESVTDCGFLGRTLLGPKLLGDEF